MNRPQIGTTLPMDSRDLPELPSSSIERAINRLEGRILSVGTLIDELEEKLNSVLTPDNETHSSPVPAPGEIQSPLADALQNRVLNLEHITGRLSALIQRVEL